MKVVGMKLASFTDKKTGEVISYGKIYVTYESKNVTGLQTEEITVKPDMVNMVKVGQEIDVLYNKYGKVQQIVPV